MDNLNPDISMMIKIYVDLCSTASFIHHIFVDPLLLYYKSSCELLISYLSNRSQRVKVGNAKSGWESTVKGFPQGSGLGPLLFNIFY